MLRRALGLLGLAVLVTLCMNGCGGSSQPISVEITASANSVDGTDTVTLTATVTNDHNSQGVSWTLSGAGTLSNQTSTSVTYTAPAATSSSQTATITATSIASATKSTSVTITIAAQPSVATTATNLASAVGATYSVQLTSSGGIAPYTWTVTGGALPPCLSLSSSGLLTGTVTSSCAGTYSVTFTVTDSGSPNKLTSSSTLTITITAAPAITFTGAMPNTGTFGVAYMGSAAAAGGSGTLTYSMASGSLPGGLSLNAATGAVTGTPTGGGTFNFAIKAADGFGDSATQSYTIVVGYPALTITTQTTLPVGYAGSAYTQTLMASGGSGTGYTWSVTSGASALSAVGLSLSSAGVLSGAAPVAGSASFAVQVQDSAGNTAPATLSVTINPGVSITTTSPLPAGYGGTSYSQTFAASGGSGSGYTWVVTAGASQLTAVGLSLSGAGVLSGAAPVAGAATFTVKVTDSVGNSATGTFAVTINPGLSITTTSPLPVGYAGVAYTQTFASSGGTGTGLSWSVTTGASSLTAVGLSLSSSGVLSGTTPVAGTATFTVQVKDSAGNLGTSAFTVAINQALTITTPTTLPVGYANLAYSQTLSASGGSGSGYTWSVTSGSSALGAIGLSLSSAGVLSGATPVTGTASFGVQVKDSAGNTTSATFSVTIDVGITITTATTLPSGYGGTPYSETLAASGGSGTGYTWTVTAGASQLAAVGLSVSSAGVVAGASPVAGSATFTVQVKDSAGNTATATFSTTIDPGLTITTASSLPVGYAGVAYTQTFASSGGTGTGLNWSVTTGASSLTALGLSLSSSGVLSGTTPVAGTATFTVQVKDSAGNVFSGSFSVTINAALTIGTTSPLSNGYAGTAYSDTLMASGGSGTGYTWSVTSGSSQLTAVGLSLSSAGVLSGTTPVAGTATFGVQVKDSAGNTATTSLTVTIGTGLTITSSNPLPAGYAGTAYSDTLAAAGGSGSGQTWSVTAGASQLTAVGLSLSSAGVLSGSSPVAGTATFTAKVVDSANNSTTATLSVTINPGLAITTTSPLPVGYAGVAYTQTFASSGGTGTGLSWSVTTGASSLTAVGLSLSSSGVLSGSTPVAGTATFTVQVKDSAGNVFSGSFSVTINAALTIGTTSPLSNGYAGTAYSDTLMASGGSGTGYTWSVTSGSSQLTAVGLSLSSAGVLSGTTPVAGTATFGVQVKDSAGNTATTSLTVTIGTGLTITSSNPLPAGYAGTAYSDTLAAAGGSGSGQTWSVTAGASQLTAVGLSLSSAGVLSGSSPVAGTATFTAKVVDSANNSTTATLSVTINPGLAITTTSPLPVGYAGVAYTQTFASAGGTGTGLNWSVTTGASSLTALGLSLSSGGVLSGTTPVAGTATFTVQVKDSAGNVITGSFSVTINAALTIGTTSPLSNGYAGTAYSDTLMASGGSGTGYTWSVTSGSSQLTAVGLSLSSAGVLSGTTPVAGTATFGVQVKDSAGNTATTSLTVTIGTGLTITSSNPLPAGYAGTAYSDTLAAAGGSGSGQTWSVTAGASQLTAVGLSLSSAGVLSGSSPVASTATFTAKVVDSANNSTTATLSVTINPGVNITTTSPLAGGYAGVAYSESFAATGGSGSGYTWSVTAGASSLTALGLSLSSGGVLSGTTPVAGTATFTVQVQDSAGNVFAGSFSVTIHSAASINDALLNGHYAFLVQGWSDGTNDGSTTQMAMAGSFVADGNGNITSGALDENNIFTSVGNSEQTFTGTYSIGANNLGQMTLNVGGSGNTVTLAISVSQPSSGSTVGGSIIEFDDTTGIGATPAGKRLSGEFTQQDTTAFTSSSLSGNFIFGMAGETCPTYLYSGSPTVSGNCPTNGGAGPTVSAGVMSLSAGTISNGVEDINFDGNANGGTDYTFTGSYGSPDAATGRTTYTLSALSGLPNGFSASWPNGFALYIVNSNQAYAISIEPHLSYTLLSGKIVRQALSSFSSSNFSGSMVGWESGVSQTYANDWGFTNAPSQSIANAALLTASGGNVTITQQENSEGTLSSSSNTFGFSVSSNGRIVQSGSVAYLSNTNTGVAIETYDNTPPGLMWFEPQTATSLAAGSYVVSYDSAAPAAGEITGLATVGAGGISTVEDVSASTGALTSASNGSATYGVNSAGLITASNGTTGYVVSSTEFVLVDSAGGGASPGVSIFQQPATGATAGALTITSASPLPAGYAGTAYNDTLTASGGSGSGQTWSVTAGSSQLSALGLTLSSAGVLSGSSAVAGTASFTVEVMDSASNTTTATLSVTINASNAGLTITTTSPLPTGAVGANYSLGLAATGGSGSGYTWTVTSGASSLSTLGLSLSSGGLLSGLTSVAGTATFTVQVEDSSNNVAFANLSVTISGVSLPSANSYSLPSGTVSVQYNGSVNATGGSGSYEFVVNGTTIPTNNASTSFANGDGLTAQNTGGPTLNFGGTPTSTNGSLQITVEVIDANHPSDTATVTYTIAVNAGLSLPSASSYSLPSGTVGVQYNGSVNATGGSGSYEFVVNGTSIPTNNGATSIANGDGLTAQNTGGPTLNFGGTPTSANGSLQLTVEVIDANHTSDTATVTYTIAVNSNTGQSVSGVVSLANQCGPVTSLPSFSLSINTTPTATITTSDSNGTFSFSNIPNGTYTITPSMTGSNLPEYEFYPSTLTNVTVNGGSVTGLTLYVSLGYTVSGSIPYSGTDTGQVYVNLIGCSTGAPGTSLSAPGSFTIRGVPPGTYTLSAWMDTIGQGQQNAVDPMGTGGQNVVVSTANSTGNFDTLLDQTAPSLSGLPGPNLSAVSPFSTGAVISYQPVENASGAEEVTSYTVEWSTSSTFPSGSTFSLNFAAIGDSSDVWIVGNTVTGSTSFSAGTPYYFRVRGNIGSSNSTEWTVWPQAVTIGANTSGYTITGAVTIPNGVSIKPGAPLYVGMYDANTAQVYVTEIGAPVTGANAFSIVVPADSSYFFFGILDENNDGLIDAGDVTNVNSNNSSYLPISGPLSNEDLTLPSGGSSVTVNSQYFQYGGQTGGYSIYFQIAQGTKLPVAVTITSGPNITTPVDLGDYCGGCGEIDFPYYPFIWTNTPVAGQSYGFQITYSDGTTDTVTSTIPAVLGSSALATLISPQGDNAGSTPNFDWSYPANASNYTYEFVLCCSFAGDVWYLPYNNYYSGFASSELTPPLVWGDDPLPNESFNTPFPTPLSAGTQYFWLLSTLDPYGDSATNETSFTTSAGTLTLPAANPSSLPSALVSTSYNGNIAVSGGTGPYTWTVTGLSDGLSYGTSGGSDNNTLYIYGTPASVETVSFQVTVQDSTGATSGPITYSIVVNAAAPLSLPAADTNPMGPGVVGFAYGSSDVSASGGSGSYTFEVNGTTISSTAYVSVSGGDGLTFSANGNTLYVSGTPAAAETVSLQVEVIDSNNTSNTATVTYSVPVTTGPNGADDANLKGTYTCLVNGYFDADGSRWGSISNLVLDGNGNVTSGAFDNNGQDLAAEAQGTMSGTYSVGSDNSGLATITGTYTSGLSGTFTNVWALSATSSTSPSQEFRMILVNDAGSSPTGRHGQADCYLDTTTAFNASTISGKSFIFNLNGADSQGVPHATAGRFDASGSSVTSGYIDQAKGGSATLSSGSLTGGSYTTPNSTTGRYTLTITSNNGSISFAVYIVNSQRAFLLATTADDGVEEGQMLTQALSTFSNANLSGNAVAYIQGYEFSDSGSPQTVTGTFSEVFETTGNGSGGLTINQSYMDDDGSYSAGNANGSTTVTFDASNPGRLTIDTGGGSTTVVYLANTNTGMEISAGGGANSVESGLFENQTQTTFSDAALAGNYMFGTMPVLNADDSDTVGQAELTSGGAATVYSSDGGQDTFSYDGAQSFTYMFDSTAPNTGTFLVSSPTNGGASCAAITSTRAVCTVQGDSSANLLIFQQ